MINEEIADLIEGMCKIQHRQLEESLHVSYSKNCPYLFAARQFKAGVLLEVGVPLDHPRFMKIIQHAAMAALEVYRGTTTAVEIRAEQGAEL